MLYFSGLSYRYKIDIGTIKSNRLWNIVFINGRMVFKLKDI